MPNQESSRRARQAKKIGKSASISAGDFVRHAIARIRAGEHGPRSTKLAIASGLLPARRAEVDLPSALQARVQPL